MKVLFLSQILPYPLDAGPKVRAYHVLRYLAERHRVTLLTFSRPDDPSEAVAHLRAFCEAVYTVPMHRSRLRDARVLVGSLLAGGSFVIRRDHVPEMAQVVDQRLAAGEFDAVHADQLWMAQYALRARNLQPVLSEAEGSAIRDPQLVLDEHNACYQIFQRLAWREHNPLKRVLLEREWRALARYEAWVCGQFDHVVMVTDEDQRAIKSQLNSRSQIRNPQFTTIPICVDPAAVQPVELLPDARDVLHLGTMFFLPNVEGVLWFAQKVWPQVSAQVPDATFTVVGKNPPKAVKQLSARNDRATDSTGVRSAIRDLQSAVHVTGYVPDPTPYLRRAAAFVVPLHSGGGMRVKILDAWCWGLPVVSTSIGVEGIDHRDGENILIAADAESFARAVVRVLREPELARRLRENGRRWVEARYDWREVYQAWSGVYGEEAGDAL